jgi:hypothetical protein
VGVGPHCRPTIAAPPTPKISSEFPPSSSPSPPPAPSPFRRYHRVKFNLEGERGKKAWVFAEVSSQTSEFRYLIVVSKDGGRVVTVVDRRPPALSTEERQSRITSLIQQHGEGWAFFADNEIDVREQSRALGEYWAKVRCVRCDEAPLRCAEAGVEGTPAWRAEKGAVVKGLKNLAELEKMVQPLAREAEGKNKKGWLW